MGVGRAASSFAVLDVVASGLRSGIDSAGRVVGVAAGGGITLLQLGREGAGNGQDGEKGGDGELHFERLARCVMDKTEFKAVEGSGASGSLNIYFI